jgi:hypothetical protein
MVWRSRPPARSSRVDRKPIEHVIGFRVTITPELLRPYLANRRVVELGCGSGIMAVTPISSREGRLRARVKDGDETPLLTAARAGAVNIDMGVGMLAAVRQTNPGREHQRRTAVALACRHPKHVGPRAAEPTSIQVGCPVSPLTS